MKRLFIIIIAIFLLLSGRTVMVSAAVTDNVSDIVIDSGKIYKGDKLYTGWYIVCVVTRCIL